MAVKQTDRRKKAVRKPKVMQAGAQFLHATDSSPKISVEPIMPEAALIAVQQAATDAAPKPYVRTSYFWLMMAVIFLGLPFIGAMWWAMGRMGLPTERAV